MNMGEARDKVERERHEQDRLEREQEAVKREQEHQAHERKDVRRIFAVASLVGLRASGKYLTELGEDVAARAFADADAMLTEEEKGS